MHEAQSVDFSEGGGYAAIAPGESTASTRPSWRTPSVALLRTALFTFGEVSMSPGHPLFRSGPVPGDMIVFPRHPFWLAREGDKTRCVDGTQAVTYFEGQSFERRAASPMGSAAFWIGVSRAFRDAHGHTSSGRFRATAIALQREQAMHAALLHASLRSPLVDAFAIEEQAVLLLSDVLEGADRRWQESRDQELMERARFVLARTFDRSVSVAEVARAVGVSPAHLSRRYRAQVGLTMQAYRRELRVRRAIGLLLDTKEGLSEIASKLGFASHAHFTLWFKRCWGETPSAFRKQIRASARRLDQRVRSLR